MVPNGTMVGLKRPGKRLREDEVENVFSSSSARDAVYLRVKFNGEKTFRSKGWPWIQTGRYQKCVRTGEGGEGKHPT